MSEVKKYGKFLDNLNIYGKLCKIIKVNNSIIIPSKEEDVKENIEILSNNNSIDRKRFNAAISILTSFNFETICRKGDGFFDYGKNEYLMDIMVNNDYIGLVNNGKIVEFKRIITRPYKKDLRIIKELKFIIPKLPDEEEVFNNMVEYVIKNKIYFFTKKHNIGYSYGINSNNIREEIINSDYFCVITTSTNVAEFKKIDTRIIDDNMELPIMYR